MAAHLNFLKMNGLGNEFIVIDARKTSPRWGRMPCAHLLTR